MTTQQALALSKVSDSMLESLAVAPGLSATGLYAHVAEHCQRREFDALLTGLLNYGQVRWFDGGLLLTNKGVSIVQVMTAVRK